MIAAHSGQRHAVCASIACNAVFLFWTSTRKVSLMKPLFKQQQQQNLVIKECLYVEWIHLFLDHFTVQEWIEIFYVTTAARHWNVKPQPRAVRKNNKYYIWFAWSSILYAILMTCPVFENTEGRDRGIFGNSD